MRFFALVAAALLVACSTVPLRPVTFDAPAGFSGRDIESAVLNALSPDGVPSRRGNWSFDGNAAGVTYARFRYDYFSMKVAVYYKETSIRMEIAESAGLGQQPDSIHEQAYAWLRTLEDRIRQEFGAVAKAKSQHQPQNP